MILGRRGTGKTTVARFLLKDKLSFVVFDVFHEYNLPGSKIFTEFSAWLDEMEIRGAWGRDVLRVEDSDFPAVSQMVFRIGGVSFLVEETDLFCNPYQIEPFLSRLIRHGRHKSVDMICVSRRPAELSRHLTANADTLFISRFVEPNDRQYLQSYGIDLAQLDSLPEFHFLKYDVVSAQAETIKVNL